MPQVSIIMPAFNADETIEASIRSVMSQTYGDWELLVVNDGSTDASVEIGLRLAASDRRIRLLGSGRNEGVAKARNLGIEASEGPYIAFLDSDDLWIPNKLATQLSVHGPMPLFSHMAYQHIRGNGKTGRTIVAPEFINYRSMLSGSQIGTLTVMIARELLGNHRFPARGHEDFALWLTLLKQVPYAQRLGTTLPYAFYRQNSRSLSGRKVMALQWMWQIYREQEGFNALKSIRHVASHALRGLSKHYL